MTQLQLPSQYVVEGPDVTPEAHCDKSVIEMESILKLFVLHQPQPLEATQEEQVVAARQGSGYPATFATATEYWRGQA